MKEWLKAVLALLACVSLNSESVLVILPLEMICRHIGVIFLLLQLVHLFVTSHVGLKHCCQLLVTVKILGEVGEPSYRAIPSAAHAPTNYEAPRLQLSWRCFTTVFSFPLISQEQMTADLYYSKFIVACGSLMCPAVTTACQAVLDTRLRPMWTLAAQGHA